MRYHYLSTRQILYKEILNESEQYGSIPRNACLGMHVSPAQHCDMWLPSKYDYWTDGQTDARQSDPYVLLWFHGDTKKDKVWKKRTN